MKVSIIVPAFNAARFIGRAIQSVFTCAAGLNFELIVVDHASTDGTREAVDAALPEGCGLRIVSAPVGGGPARAKNVGFEMSRGDLITFLDADDVMVDLKARVEQMHWNAVFGRIGGLIDENDAPVSDPAFDAWVASCDAKNRHAGTISPQRIARSELPGYFTLLYRRSLLEREVFRMGTAPGPFDESLDRAEDFDLAYRCSLDGPIEFVDAVSVLYRVHDSNMSVVRRDYGVVVRPETRAAHQRALQKHGLAT